MSNRGKLGAATRALVAGAIIAVAAFSGGGITLAANPAPVTNIPAGADGFINAAEVSSITLSGTYDITAGINQIIADISANPADNNDPCSLSASYAPAQTVVVNGTSGTWSIGPFSASGFAEGLKICGRSRSSDDAGVNYGALSTTAPSTPIKDTVAPVPTSVVITTAPVTASNVTAVKVAVAGEVGATANVSLDDTTAAPAVTGSGASPVTLNASSLGDGALTATATLTDAAGNTGAPTVSASVTKDTTAPGVPVIDTPVAGSIVRASVTIAGDAQPGSTITIAEEVFNPATSLTDTVVIGSVVTDLQGAWKKTVTNVSAGDHVIKARAGDAFGNTSAYSATVAFKVDADLPLVTITTIPGSPVVPGNPTPVYLPGDAVVIGGTATDKASPIYNSGVLAVEVNVFDIRCAKVDEGPARTDTCPGDKFGISTGSVKADGHRDPAAGPALSTNRNIRQENASCALCPTGKSVTWSFDATALPSGSYAVQVFSIDRAGNRSAQPATLSFIKV